MKFKLGQKVWHETYGAGIVIFVGYSRRGSEQYGIKFELGGPQGWAENATNNVEDLLVIQ